MALPRGRAVLAATVLLLIATASKPAQPPDHGIGCAGTTGECAGGSARRELWGSNYIGYAALSRAAVPCSWRGASYYNCRPGAQANPYSRGCSSITRCRG